MTMGAEQALKRSFDQIDAEIDSRGSSQHSSKRPHEGTELDFEVDKSCQQVTEGAHKLIEPEIKIRLSSLQATLRSHDLVGVEAEVGKSSKRPRLDERRLPDPRGFYMQRKNLPWGSTHTSTAQKTTSSDHDSSPSTSKAARPSGFKFDRRRLLDPKSFFARDPGRSPSKALPTSHISSTRSPKPSPAASPRPTFDQLAKDGQQGMKVLFLVDHATKGDAVHCKITTMVPEASSEMKLLMNKYRSDRSSFQNRFFAKARTFCAQLTSRHEFLELVDELKDTNTWASRLAYFNEKCTKAHLSTLYSHLASAVDIPKILSARTPNDKAFKNLMTQVFIHTMEDLWCFELHPSKRDLPAKREKENKEDVYIRFRNLTDRVHGLPAARDMPGYLEVPLQANFPRYVLFDQDPRPRNEQGVSESDKKSDNKVKEVTRLILGSLPR